MVVPGWTQWRGKTPRRALVLFGSYVSALVVAGFAWGSSLGGLMIAIAVATHIAATADVIRRSVFPGFGAWVPWLTAAVGVGGLGYLPLFSVIFQFAYPTGGATTNYLVNRLAYLHDEPRPGDWVWIEEDRPAGAAERAPETARRRVVCVVAVEGQTVDWDGSSLTVDGRAAPLRARDGARDPCRGLTLTVPRDTLFVIAAPDPSGFGSAFTIGGSILERLQLVALSQVQGRAWARAYPVWSRALTS